MIQEGWIKVKNKKELRKIMIEKLSKIDSDKRLDISEEMQKELFKSKLWNNAKTIGTYISSKYEWDTRNIIEEAFKAGKKVAVPKTISDVRRMDFYQISDLSQVEKVKSGQFTLEEPIIEETVYLNKNKIDLLFVPGLIFSRDGYRIGLGGGYYDRFLPDFTNTSVSLALEKQIKESIPTKEYDMPVKYIITENEIVG